MKRRFVSYCRVSSKKQSDGYSLEAQSLAVQRYLNTLPFEWELIAQISEVETGANDDRPELKRAIQLAQAQQATIIIAKLDRIGRSLKLLLMLNESNTDFVAADMPHCDRFTAKLLMLISERERELIAQRTRAGLEIAKARGVKLGNPNAPTAWKHAANAIQERKRAFNAQALKSIKEIQSTGVTSLYQICRYLNLRGIRTARGKEWTVTAVRRCLNAEQCPI